MTSYTISAGSPVQYDPLKAYQTGGLTTDYSPGPSSALPAGPGFGYAGSQDIYTPPTTTTGGGGGTGGQVLGASTDTGTPTTDISGELNAIFDPVFQALNGQQATTQANYDITKNDINQQQVNAEQKLGVQKASSETQLNQLGQEATGTKEDALTSATRLYNELQRGGQQRFGGASSAGEAYQTLTATEQQRRQGTIYDQFQASMAKIAQFKNDLIQRFDSAIIDLQSQTKTALSQAQQQFNDAIQQIQSNKAQAESDKATATLNNLQDLRNKVYTINLQNIQFAQTLAANKQASLAQVDNYTQQVMNSLNQGGSTVQNLSSNLRNVANNTSLGVSSGQQAPAYQPTGQVTPQKKDLYGNALA